MEPKLAAPAAKKQASSKAKAEDPYDLKLNIKELKVFINYKHNKYKTSCRPKRYDREFQNELECFLVGEVMKWNSACWIVAVEQNRNHKHVHDCLGCEWSILNEILNNKHGAKYGFTSNEGEWEQDAVCDSTGAKVFSLGSCNRTDLSRELLLIWRDILVKLLGSKSAKYLGMKILEDLKSFLLYGKNRGAEKDYPTRQRFSIRELLEGGFRDDDEQSRGMNHWDDEMRLGLQQLEEIFNEERFNEFKKNPTAEEFNGLTAQDTKFREHLLKRLKPTEVSTKDEILTIVKFKCQTEDVTALSVVLDQFVPKLSSIHDVRNAITTVYYKGSNEQRSKAKELTIKLLRDVREHLFDRVSDWLLDFREGIQNTDTYFPESFANTQTPPAKESMATAEKWAAKYLSNVDENHVEPTSASKSKERALRDEMTFLAATDTCWKVLQRIIKQWPDAEAIATWNGMVEETRKLSPGLKFDGVMNSIVEKLREAGGEIEDHFLEIDSDDDEDYTEYWNDELIKDLQTVKALHSDSALLVLKKTTDVKRKASTTAEGSGEIKKRKSG